MNHLIQRTYFLLVFADEIQCGDVSGDDCRQISRSFHSSTVHAVINQSAATLFFCVAPTALQGENFKAIQTKLSTYILAE